MKPHVLILDDEAAIGRSLSRTLRQYGFDVTACEHPDAANAVLNEREVAVVVCDQRMPTIDGVTFLEDCAHAHPATVRILLTGYAEAEVAAAAVNRASVFRILWKPWADAEIVEAVRQASWMHGFDCNDDEVTPVTPLQPPLDPPKLAS
jgi:DNA-binding NtrC family response regulator